MPMIQIITNNKQKFSGYSSDKSEITITMLDSFQSFDDFDINIVDLNDKKIWRNERNSNREVNCLKDINSLAHEIDDIKKSKVLIVLPLNVDFCWEKMIDQYYFSEQLKNMQDEFLNIVNKLTFLDNIVVHFSKTKTKINNTEYIADFSFDSNSEFENFGKKLESEKSNKVTLIEKDDISHTTLDIFENFEKFEIIITYLYSKEIDVIPEWVKEYEYLDDKKLKECKDETKKKIETLQSEEEEIDNKLFDNNNVKGLLYKNGDELEDLGREIIGSLLDDDLKNFKDEGNEDFLVRKDDITFVGEIKGISGAVKNTIISQLEVHLQGYSDKLDEIGKNENVKGLLIVNHHRQKELKNREEIHHNQIELSEKYGALIIETVTLLKLYEKFNEKKISSVEVINLLKDKTGLLKENDF